MKLEHSTIKWQEDNCENWTFWNLNFWKIELLKKRTFSKTGLFDNISFWKLNFLKSELFNNWILENWTFEKMNFSTTEFWKTELFNIWILETELWKAEFLGHCSFFWQLNFEQLNFWTTEVKISYQKFSLIYCSWGII